MKNEYEYIIIKFSEDLMQWCLWKRIVSDNIDFILETYYKEVEENEDKILELKKVKKENQWWWN